MTMRGIGIKAGQLVSLFAVYYNLAFNTQLASCESVRVDFGQIPQPLFSQSDNQTILTNSAPQVQLSCSASYPTEWIVNVDLQNLRANTGGRSRQEWTNRKYDKNIDEPSYNYIAWIQLEYSRTLREEERLLCRSVTNHSDNVLVKLEASEDGKQVLITHHPNVASDTKNATEASCKLKFEVTLVGSRYYWRCLSAETGLPAANVPSIKLYGCQVAAFCASSFRDVKARPTCLTVVSGLSDTDVTTDSSWMRMQNNRMGKAGVAVCSPPGWSMDNRAAVEYFFEGPGKNVSNKGPRKIRFSQPETDMKDLIWMDPPLNKKFHTLGRLETNCRVMKYGFSSDPVVIVTLNGSTLIHARSFNDAEENGLNLWSKFVSIKLSETGPGTYQVHCIAPVWNTTEWANRTKTVQVTGGVAPQLRSGVETENVTFEEGDVNKQLVCDVTGDPIPKVTWDVAGTPGVRVDSSDDRILVFNRMSVVLHDDSVITCTAENDYGQTVMKSFHVHVRPEPLLPVTVSASTIGAIVAAVIFAILLGAGLLYLYFKFQRLGTAIATYLTHDEVKEFREGRKQAAPPGSKTNSGYANADIVEKHREEEQAVAIESLPYNSEFEVAKDNFFVDLNAELGAGEYGIVYRGHIKQNPRDQNPLPVAVKTVRKNVHINYFKALMSELKILAYIGHHESIVNLIGAYSNNIKNRELYVGVELCKTSLLRFLQDNRQSFKNCIQPKTGLLIEETTFSPYANQSEANSAAAAKTMTTFDLVRWAEEIASGMEFLSKKRVVHGDLATRNILISFDLRAKICDFGLARQLIDYNYIKSQQCPLPWRWMAIESLAQMKFSTMSDVWAYGVTLWEIFSLGNVPYPGMAWNLDFVDQLLNGLRLPKPTYASDTIYGEMLGCWHENPKKRPKFSALKQFFHSLGKGQ